MHKHKHNTQNKTKSQSKHKHEHNDKHKTVTDTFHKHSHITVVHTTHRPFAQPRRRGIGPGNPFLLLRNGPLAVEDDGADRRRGKHVDPVLAEGTVGLHLRRASVVQLRGPREGGGSY